MASAMLKKAAEGGITSLPVNIKLHKVRSSETENMNQTSKASTNQSSGGNSTKRYSNIFENMTDDEGKHEKHTKRQTKRQQLKVRNVLALKAINLVSSQTRLIDSVQLLQVVFSR